MAPEDISLDDMAPDDISLDIIGSDVIASEVIAAELSAAADVVLVAAVEPDPQAARVTATAAPATRRSARFMIISCSLEGAAPTIGTWGCEHLARGTS
jgi:hypothetical protein